jgi:hypothetical protein
MGGRVNFQKYLKLRGINLCFLIAGALLSQFVERSWQLYEAHAQEPVAGRPSTPSSEYEYVSPGFTIGVAGFNQALAHQIASDQIMVQGVDLMKLHEATLNLLIAKKVATASEVQKVIDDSKVKHPLKIKVQ